jgi:acyl dehydratase
MKPPTIIPSLDAIGDYVGKPLGVTEWMTITQERVNAFAEATGDHQWIHVDPERAARESPWKTTIAHGYLTLSLAPVLIQQLFEVRGVSTVINTGIEKMRLSSPIPTGSRLRMSCEIKNVRSLPQGGGVRVSLSLRFEVEGVSKPACLATVNLVYMP